MIGKKSMKWLAVLMIVLFLVAGCAELGVLYEKPRVDGGVDRLRIDGGENWSEYDITPRYQSQKPKDQDGYYMMLKSEKTF